MVKKAVVAECKNEAEQILDIITKALDDGKAQDVIVMDLQGKKDKINISNLKSGVYFLQMKVNSKILNLRVIKQ